jgi:hypothetical protein
MYGGSRQRFNTNSQYVRTQSVPARDMLADPTVRGGTLNDTQAANRSSPEMDEVTAPSMAGSPLAWLFAIIGIFLVMRYVIEGESGESSLFGEIQLSIWNMFVISLFAITGSVILKTLTVKYLASNNPIRVIVTAA